MVHNVHGPIVGIKLSSLAHVLNAVNSKRDQLLWKSCLASPSALKLPFRLPPRFLDLTRPKKLVGFVRVITAHPPPLTPAKNDKLKWRRR